MSYIVNSQHACRLREMRVSNSLEIECYQCSWPVVHMRNIGNEVFVFANLQRSLRQKREAKRVVAVLPRTIVINARTREIAFAIHKPHRHFVSQCSVMNTDPL